MPSSSALAAVAKAALHPLNVGLRSLSQDEIELLAEAVDAGAHVHSDGSYEDFLNGGALPLSWGAHGAGRPGYAAGADARREAFQERLLTGDLRFLAERVSAERSARAARLCRTLDYIAGAAKGQHADPAATLRDIAAQAAAALKVAA